LTFRTNGCGPLRFAVDRCFGTSALLSVVTFSGRPWIDTYSPLHFGEKKQTLGITFGLLYFFSDEKMANFRQRRPRPEEFITGKELAGLPDRPARRRSHLPGMHVFPSLMERCGTRSGTDGAEMLTSGDWVTPG